jgi:hypothetical protein
MPVHQRRHTSWYHIGKQIDKEIEQERSRLKLNIHLQQTHPPLTEPYSNPPSDQSTPCATRVPDRGPFCYVIDCVIWSLVLMIGVVSLLMWM